MAPIVEERLVNNSSDSAAGNVGMGRGRTHSRSPLVGCALAVALLTGVSACGDDASDAGQPAVVEVIATDFEFADLPDTVPAGTRLTLRNDAPSELHELVAFRLPDDEERSVSELMALPPDELMPAMGGPPVAVLLAPPGGEQIAAVGDGTLAEPGRYAILCVIPTGIEPDVYLEAAAISEGPPDVGGGPPHIVHGMYAELRVEG